MRATAVCAGRDAASARAGSRVDVLARTGCVLASSFVEGRRTRGPRSSAVMWSYRSRPDFQRLRLESDSVGWCPAGSGVWAVTLALPVAGLEERGFSDVAGRARCRVVPVWLAAASAPASMVAAGWYGVVRSGGSALGGDMVGHAAAAQWLGTLAWWDWRGWSDWFYGGQAMGVNYPPLGHAWMRLTHPVHGQMVAVAAGLLVLLPWGAIRLGRAVGLPERAQWAGVVAVLALTSASADMHWVLSGFHSQPTFYGGWPAMLAVVCGLFAAAWAARCAGALCCGCVVGLSVLLNATVVAGTVLVCAALLATSGAPWRQVCPLGRHCDGGRVRGVRLVAGAVRGGLGPLGAMGVSSRRLLARRGALAGSRAGSRGCRRWLGRGAQPCRQATGPRGRGRAWRRGRR